MKKRVQISSLLFFFSLMFIGCEHSEKQEDIVKAVYKGEKDMAWAIAHYIEYPINEMKFNRAGIVEVTFQVDEEGNVNQVKATLDKEIKAAEVAIGRKRIEGKSELAINLPVLQSLIKSVEKLNFHPAKKNGKSISSTITTSVEFILI